MELANKACCLQNMAEVTSIHDKFYLLIMKSYARKNRTKTQHNVKRLQMRFLYLHLENGIFCISGKNLFCTPCCLECDCCFFRKQCWIHWPRRFQILFDEICWQFSCGNENYFSANILKIKIIFGVRKLFDFNFFDKQIQTQLQANSVFTQVHNSFCTQVLEPRLSNPDSKPGSFNPVFTQLQLGMYPDSVQL